jgi:hypothetical protein
MESDVDELLTLVTQDARVEEGTLLRGDEKVSTLALAAKKEEDGENCGTAYRGELVGDIIAKAVIVVIITTPAPQPDQNENANRQIPSIHNKAQSYTDKVRTEHDVLALEMKLEIVPARQIIRQNLDLV